MKEFGIIVQTKEFEEGDVICHINNWNIGIPMFGKATDNDVEKYSGKNSIYLKLIQTSKLELINKPVETTNEQPNILDIINKFNPDKYIKEGENKLNKNTNMLLDYTTFLLQKLNVITNKEHICNGGTCTFDSCKNIGKIVICDTGCTYPG